jgi:hypothetical protein
LQKSGLFSCLTLYLRLELLHHVLALQIPDLDGGAGGGTEPVPTNISAVSSAIQNPDHQGWPEAIVQEVLWGKDSTKSQLDTNPSP